jgi:hypothetical protein
MQTNDEPALPHTSTWQPKPTNSKSLSTAFLSRCKSAEAMIQLRAKLERDANINNFDSGAGVEDILREELRCILPRRYAITAGVINDRDARTAGDFEIIIFNDTWFPAMKVGATTASRRWHYPVEGVYGVIEVKQSLSLQTLDAAMEKLVVAHRLNRLMIPNGRLTENRHSDRQYPGLSNPLYSAIVAVGMSPGVTLQSAIERFFDISKSLKRLELVRALCVLGEGAATWAWRDDNGEPCIATFMEGDLALPLIPVFHRSDEIGSALYPLMVDLLQHLYHSVLGPEDILGLYGLRTHKLSAPSSPNVFVSPDPRHVQEFEGHTQPLGAKSP